MSLLLIVWSAISVEVIELGARSPAVSESGATSEEATAFSAISSELTASLAISSLPTESVPRSLEVTVASAILGELTALSRRSTVRTEPLTIWFEPMLALAARADPVSARNRARQLMMRAGEGRNLVLLVILGLLCLGWNLMSTASARPRSPTTDPRGELPHPEAPLSGISRQRRPAD